MKRKLQADDGRRKIIFSAERFKVEKFFKFENKTIFIMRKKNFFSHFMLEYYFINCLAYFPRAFFIGSLDSNAATGFSSNN